MIIKCGRREFTVTENDLILDNGACYILITQSYQDGWSKCNPTVAKSTFKKLLKEGKLKLSPRKYKGTYGSRYDLYQFVEV